MSKRRGPGEGSIVKRKTCSQCGKVASSSSEASLKICKDCGADLPSKGRWMGAATIGFDVENNRPHRKYFYGNTRGEVLEKMDEARARQKSGQVTEPSRLMLAEWLDTWLNDYMKPSLRPTTWESYETQVRKHIKPALGHVRLNQLQTAHLQKLYNEKLKGGRADGGEGGLSPRSVRYIHNTIRGALEQAKKEGKIMINPADAVKLPQEPKKEMQTLDTEAVKIFLNGIKGHRHYAAFLLEMATGLRRGELLALRWKDVDLDSGTITVSQNIVRVKGRGLVFQEPKTNYSRRTINIPPNIVKELKAHKIRQGREKWDLQGVYQDNDLLFPTPEGKPTDPRTFSGCFKNILYKLKVKGMPYITFHGLRHTFATMSLQEGVSPRTIQETLGHHSAAFTMSVYSHVTDKMKKEATDKIGDLLASCMEE